MSRRKESSLTPGMWLFVIIVGGGGYLLMEHPLIFWLVALPLFLWIVVSIIRWIFK